MAGANNKSAKGLGYTAKQIETVRKSGGILSHAALMASGDPARPTKKFKALAADMAERKAGMLTQRVAAAQRGTLSMTRNMLARRKEVAAMKAEVRRIQAALDAANARQPAPRKSLIVSTKPSGNLNLYRHTERRYELSERLGNRVADLREARRSAMNAGDDARVAKLDSQIARTQKRADRASDAWLSASSRLSTSPAAKRQQWARAAENEKQRKTLVARAAQNLGGVSKAALGMRKKAAAAKARQEADRKQQRLTRIASRYSQLRHALGVQHQRAGEARARAHDALLAAKRTKNKTKIAEARAAHEAASAAFVKAGDRHHRAGRKEVAAKIRAGQRV